MPLKRRTRGSFEPVTFQPFAADGLDQNTNAAGLDFSRLVRAENVRFDDGTLSRRKGARKRWRATSSVGSWTFGATTKYAKIDHAAHLLIPEGGFALRFSITAVRPSGGNTAYILASRLPSQTYGVLWATLSDAGVLTVNFRTSAGSTLSLNSSALDAGAEAHVLAVYDAPAGTWTLYVNGTQEAQTTGLDATLKPDQTGPDWYVGVEYDPSGAAVTANTNFDGKVDALTLLSLRGTTPSDGLTTMLRKWSLQQWPNPASGMVLFNYDFDEGSGTTLVDSSRFKNDGTLTGGPSATAEVARRVWPGNYVKRLDYPSNRRVNAVGVGGALHYEDLRGATA